MSVPSIPSALLTGSRSSSPGLHSPSHSSKDLRVRVLELVVGDKAASLFSELKQAILKSDTDDDSAKIVVSYCEEKTEGVRCIAVQTSTLYSKTFPQTNADKLAALTPEQRVNYDAIFAKLASMCKEDPMVKETILTIEPIQALVNSEILSNRVLSSL